MRERMPKQMAERQREAGNGRSHGSDGINSEDVSLIYARPRIATRTQGSVVAVAPGQSHLAHK